MRLRTERTFASRFGLPSVGHVKSELVLFSSAVRPRSAEVRSARRDRLRGVLRSEAMDPTQRSGDARKLAGLRGRTVRSVAADLSREAVHEIAVLGPGMPHGEVRVPVMHT